LRSTIWLGLDLQNNNEQNEKIDISSAMQEFVNKIDGVRQDSEAEHSVQIDITNH
jgi:poly(A) polymerase Pap1